MSCMMLLHTIASSSKKSLVW